MGVYRFYPVHLFVVKIMHMLLENLIPHGFQTQLHYPPQSLEERPLKELYLSLSETYRYDQFSLLGAGQGAVLKQGNHRHTEIYPDRLTVKEQPTSLSFDEYSEQALAIAKEIREKIRIPVWVLQQSQIRFLVPFEEAVTPLMKERIFSVPDEALQVFERPILGMCLRLEFPPTTEKPSQMQLRVEPYFRPNEEKMLYLELTSRFLQPTPNNEEISLRDQEAYAFIREKACSFLETCFAAQD